MKVKVGFSKGRTLFSKTICLLDNSEFSHTFFLFESETLNRDIIYQSNLLGVNFINRENFKQHSNILYEIEFEISRETYIRLMQFCIDRASTKYDFKGLLGKALIRLNLINKNPWNDNLKTVDCSEIVDAILKEQGIDTKLDLSVDGPKQIYEFLKN